MVLTKHSLTKHSCGCTGTVVDGKTAKAFIRYAEIRDNPVEEDSRPCPNHKQGSSA